MPGKRPRKEPLRVFALFAQEGVESEMPAQTWSGLEKHFGVTFSEGSRENVQVAFDAWFASRTRIDVKIDKLDINIHRELETIKGQLKNVAGSPLTPANDNTPITPTNASSTPPAANDNVPATTTTATSTNP